jgi:hypothetical protein
MNHAEFLTAMDYRKRLEGLLVAACQTMSQRGFEAFAGGINRELARVELEIVAHLFSRDAKSTSWMGMSTRTYSLSNLQKPIPEPTLLVSCTKEDFSISESVFDQQFPVLQTC